MTTIEKRLQAFIDSDPLLHPYAEAIRRRTMRLEDTQNRLTGGNSSLADFASGHEYFGLHYRNDAWIFREWAPNATAVYLIGEVTGWTEKKAFALEKSGDDGVWEIHLSSDKLAHLDLYRLRIHWPGGSGDRIPAYARRVVQDPGTLIFNAQVWHPPRPYRFKHRSPGNRDAAPLIYEAHVGMAQEEGKIGSYVEFTHNILPRIVAAGYNTLQLMAVTEHPFYGSFGYQVANFFASSSRFGTPDELKELIDTAHNSGLRIIMDLVHSHAASNEVEGLSRFDGSGYQYFHGGDRGRHVAWDSRLFDYGKHQVLHFLLSNCRYWLDEFQFDGFRFDGITSMLYLHHGLGTAFTSYRNYFDDTVEEDALVYLGLANRLIHAVRPQAITIAEDISGMPGLAVPDEKGGFGFDFRFSMGVPDLWIRLTKETRDEDWPMGHLWSELNNRRADEKTISYAESHDQALVGDQSLIFRMIGADMYEHMRIDDDSLSVARGLALHKLMRLITLVTAGAGYLNFMGNEFGHPEWIDFPRSGNNWSYHFARRQWHLVDDPQLKYHLLARFDQQMIAMAKAFKLLDSPGPRLLHEHSDDKVIACERAGLIFGFNFHPYRSYSDYRIMSPPGPYRMILDSDSEAFGGHGRLTPGQEHFSVADGANGPHHLSLYLPHRTGIVLEAAGDHKK
ncbi:MAG: alpha amylase C-terminal domain-containing protein [Desulfobacterales bacterium]